MALDEKWKQSVDDGITNQTWDDYDDIIKREVEEYNRRLATTPGYICLDWKLFKAMEWVESGGPSNAAWKTRPMQIGNVGDPGYQALKTGEGAASLIMSDALTRDIKAGDINSPDLNIRAGVAYAITRLSKSDIKPTDDPKDPVQEYTMLHDGTLFAVATKVGATLESIKALNPGVISVKKGQKVKYRKAKMKRVITGWRMASTVSLAERYNAGDSNYQAKLDYVLALFPKLKR